MEKITKKLTASLVILFISTQPTFAATCTLNGEEIPCGEISKWLLAFPIVMGLVGLLFFVFWLRMLLDAIKNQTEHKTMWVLLIIFLNILGSIIYYFSEKRKRNNV